jgi:hypothetical protein
MRGIRSRGTGRKVCMSFKDTLNPHMRKRNKRDAQQNHIQSPARTIYSPRPDKAPEAI